MSSAVILWHQKHVLVLFVLMLYHISVISVAKDFAELPGLELGRSEVYLVKLSRSQPK